MKFLSAIFAVSLCFCVQDVFSETAAEQLLSEQLKNLDSYKARFQQTVVEEDGYILDENFGVMSFERPSKLYWNILEPFSNLLVSNGEQVYFYDPDLDQVTVRNWSSDPLKNPVAVFIGGNAISDYYGVQETNGQFVLTPKTVDSGFSEIKIGFEEGVPTSMVILDTLGQLTTILFSVIESGNESGAESLKIPENPYIFTIPVTAEVINDR